MLYDMFQKIADTIMNNSLLTEDFALSHQRENVPLPSHLTKHRKNRLHNRVELFIPSKYSMLDQTLVVLLILNPLRIIFDLR